jgi:hypothetical protein
LITSNQIPKSRFQRASVQRERKQFKAIPVQNEITKI